MQAQEAACAALGELLSQGGDVMVPFIPQLLAAFSVAFSKYQAKNLLSLFDSVACLAGKAW